MLPYIAKPAVVDNSVRSQFISVNVDSHKMRVRRRGSYPHAASPSTKVDNDIAGGARL
jgi:hypothetical protein